MARDSESQTTSGREEAQTEAATQAQTRNFRLLSMFAGCGGMDLGFLGGFDFLGRHYGVNQFELAWANELNPAACRTYRSNFGHPIIEGDVWEAIKTLPPAHEVDVVIGGFPCQDISVNGKGMGVSGPRSGLYRAMVNVIERLRPKAFVAENVKGLLMKHNRSSLETVLKDFGQLGYQLSLELYHSAEYGVPQSRERIFIVGTCPTLRPFRKPACTHPKTKWVTAEQALGDLVHHPEDKRWNHVWSRAERSAEQGNRRLRADRVGYTIRAECHGNIQYHYALDRRISMREAARIQSFPDSFVFQSKLRETERQIGNAVPPVLAWHIARQLQDVLLSVERP